MDYDIALFCKFQGICQWNCDGSHSFDCYKFKFSNMRVPIQCKGEMTKEKTLSCLSLSSLLLIERF